MRIGFEILNFLLPWIRDKHPGSATLVLTSKHTRAKKGYIPKTAEETGGAGFLNSEVLAASAASDPPKTKDFLARVTGLGRKEEP
jgi:hypothetical protein